MAYAQFGGLSPKELQNLTDSKIWMSNTSSNTTTTGNLIPSGSIISLGVNGGWTLASSPFIATSVIDEQVKDVIPKRRVSCQEHYNDICSLLGIIRALKVN